MQIPNEWMNDPSLSSISLDKLTFLSILFQQGSHLDAKAMLPFLASISKQTKEHNLTFTQDELTLILKVFEKYATPEEAKKIEKGLEIVTKKAP